VKETVEDLIEELAVTAVIGIAAAFLSAGAVAATAKAAESVAKYGKIIRRIIETWKVSKNIKTGVKKVHDVAGIRKKLERLKNLGKKAKKEEGSPPVPRVKVPEDAPKGISGYTKHAEERIAGRDGGVGVSRDALTDAFQNPVRDVERLVDSQGRVQLPLQRRKRNHRCKFR